MALKTANEAFRFHARMRAMRQARRLVSLFAIAAIAWTALWPLVSSLEASLASEATPLCHMAGMEVPIGEAPANPAAPGERGKTHCPLCIMAFHVAFAATPPTPRFVFHTVVVTRDRHDAPLFSRFESPLPPSRAPPASILL